MNSVTLQPSRYVCPEHKLTAQIRRTLGADGAGAPAIFRRQDAAPLPFRVMVTCPGPDGGDPHDMVCRGTYLR
jgi:hypothetical protein